MESEGLGRERETFARRGKVRRSRAIENSRMWDRSKMEERADESADSSSVGWSGRAESRSACGWWVEKGTGRTKRWALPEKWHTGCRQ